MVRKQLSSRCIGKEVLAGSADNFGRHGRRMANVFFRMIFF